MKRYLLLLLAIISVLAGAALAAPPAQIDNLGAFSNALRIDLERLADEALGDQPRPEGWTANVDIASGTMLSDLWFDNELLANSIFGDGVRPPNWFGLTSSRAEIIGRNVRHDLELAADEVFVDATGRPTRPPEWMGALNRYRCSRTLQNVIMLADRLLNIEPQTLESTLNYCQVVQTELEEQVANELGLPNEPGLSEMVLAVRGDLERLADEALGLNARPPNYIRNLEIESPTFTGDLFLDLELLANELLGVNVRPTGWIGGISNNLYISWRNLRHDLELLADEAMGPDARPRGWQRASQLEGCQPEVQMLVLLVNEFEFSLEGIGEQNFCVQAAAAANQLAENPPVEDVVIDGVGGGGDSRFRGESQAAFTYLDVGATEYMGVMPQGTEFRAWYRNFGESGMMFVSGDDFAVFIDRRWTSLPEEIFERLPTLEGIAPLTFCDANWCNGPGPTPTPTGSGPLALLLAEATAPAPPPLEEIGDKTQVSWSNIRITYLNDNPATRTTQVALEICTEQAQINCEPVLRVFDNAAGAPKAVLSQYNGLNVYEFPYGYSTNLLIEGATLTSPDIWISDPSFR